MELCPLKGDLTATGVSHRRAGFRITAFYTLAEINYHLPDLETPYM